MKPLKSGFVFYYDLEVFLKFLKAKKIKYDFFKPF
ncbi:Uncharacterised protein [Candidatus Ornithobacterium hominis]|nr:Uncharacterised protein [Candidatus Ornithobacterium hominis]